MIAGDRYIITQEFSDPGSKLPDPWNAESPHEATFEDTVWDLLWGQYHRVTKVYCFNPLLEKSADVSAEVAEQLVLLSQEQGLSLLPELISFVSDHGVDPGRAWHGGPRHDDGQLD